MSDPSIGGRTLRPWEKSCSVATALDRAGNDHWRRESTISLAVQALVTHVVS